MKWEVLNSLERLDGCHFEKELDGYLLASLREKKTK